MSAVDLLLSYGFLQRALAAALLVSVLASVLGVPLVLRRLSMFGLGLAHVAFAGVAIGFAVGVYPLGVALVLAVASALAIQFLWSRGILESDAALAVVTSVGFATGLLVVSASRGFGTDLNSYLFGNLLAITRTDLLLMGGLGVALLGVFGLLYKEILYVTFDEEAARLSGLPVGALNALFMSLTAGTVVLASRLAGLLLVAALLVVPAASGLQLAGSFRGAILASVGVGVLGALLGVLGALEWGLSTGASVVLAQAGIFVVVVMATGGLAAGLSALGGVAEDPPDP